MIKKINIKDTTKITGIYLIKYPNNKVYIGQAQNIHLRILEHNSRAKNNHRGDGKEIQICDKAIRKYFEKGVQEYYILEECPIEELDKKEDYWINYYDALNKEKGYNLLDKGDVSGRRGTNHPNASITENQLKEIINLLINNLELSYQDIADKVGTSLNIVQNICWGKRYVKNNLDYPLRRYSHQSMKKDSVEDYFKNEEELLKFKECLKYDWDLNIEEEIPKKWNIPRMKCKDINYGRLFSEYGEYDYPIRSKNAKNNHHFSKKDILEILKMLRETTMSMTEIGKQYGIGRASVSSINKGLSYIIKDYDYPARKTN